MVLPNSTYNSFETGLNNAKTVVSLEGLYESVRNQIGKLRLVVLVFVLGLPFVLFFPLWLRTKRKKFQRRMKRDLPNFKSQDDYVRFKEHLQKLSEMSPSLKKITSYNTKKAPWLLKFTLVQMQKMSSTLLTYEDWLKSKLNCLNEEQFKSSATHFKFLSENELWRSRNQVYKYWM